jgi:hypothetical protein
VKETEPPISADERRLKNKLLIGVHRRSSAAKLIFQSFSTPAAW